MSVNEQGHHGKYSGNSRHTRVTSHNFAATRRDDQAHMQYLKEDIDYDDKHGHSDIDMTADEKHISKLAGDMKYDKDHHGSPARHEREDKKEHLHKSIKKIAQKKKMGKIERKAGTPKPIINKETGERLPQEKK